MSFPDPHHPYDPPSSENHRVDWRDIDVDELYGTSDAERVGWLDQKPGHWKWWWNGDKFVSFEALDGHSYQDELDTPDKIAEINAKIHISNAMMDDAIGNVLAHLEAKGWLEDTDIIFTPDVPSQRSAHRSDHVDRRTTSPRPGAMHVGPGAIESFEDHRVVYWEQSSSLRWYQEPRQWFMGESRGANPRSSRTVMPTSRRTGARDGPPVRDQRRSQPQRHDLPRAPTSRSDS